MTKDQMKIKNCPFCGSDNVEMKCTEIYPKDCSIYELKDNQICEIIFVMCCDCEAQGPNYVCVHDIKDDVSLMETDQIWDKWNNRYEPANKS